VVNYTDESQLPPALSTGVGLVITGEENVGEEYFERVVGEEKVEEILDEEVLVTEETPIAEAPLPDDFMSYMNSIGVATSEEDEQVDSTLAQTENDVNEPTMADSTEEEIEEKVAPVRKPRKPFGESMMGRFKGFFENDDAVN
jgi:hypothetical protein